MCDATLTHVDTPRQISIHVDIARQCDAIKWFLFVAKVLLCKYFICSLIVAKLAERKVEIDQRNIVWDRVGDFFDFFNINQIIDFYLI